MELSVLTLRVVLLFFPGVLCALIVHALTIQRERTTPQFLTSAFVYGVSTYLLLAGLRAISAGCAKLLGWGPPPRVTFFNVLTNEKARIAWGEIGLSVIVALLLALVMAVVLNNNVLHKAAERMGISRRFGEVDVWGYFFNSPQIRWVAVRDLATDTVYEGWVEAFSDTGAAPEVLLRDVTVKTNSTGTKLFDSKRVYLSRDKTSLIIEQL
ncbi:MAG TPA: DUF6338 family protein [Longimicrobium sp.]|nr:DUF6338 family protein [Longimicrobium sp.]